LAIQKVMDLAVGIIIGTAFIAIVNSLVTDIIMPPIGMAIGGVDFSSLVWTLKAAEGETPAVTMNIGIFLNAIIQFLIIAFVVFLLVRAMNNMMTRFQRKQEEVVVVVEPTNDEKLLEAIKELTAAIKAQK
jgi:large conductance mechanosensitive channel